MNASEFRAVIRASIERKGGKGLDMARKCANVSAPTFRKYWENPTNFSIYQFEAICRGLKITDEEKARIMEVKA